ncbi:MAG: translocation protein TolB [Alphaproteobacteria bacterium ADurb.Bin438]|nr:MAG: translocation protein TolB [Alphaproteobacteria bacterium ADurb.Bin438]
MKKIIFYIVFCLSFISQAKAELSLDITGAYSEPMPIAIPEFLGRNEKEIALGKNMSEIISNNLKSSGLFRIIDKKSFVQNFASVDVMPRFADWQVINAQALVQGKVEIENGKAKVTFRLWDVFSSVQMDAKMLASNEKSFRQLAHMVSDDIFKRITSEEGYFNTRIVYIMETGSGINRIKRLAVMDQDGENHQILPTGEGMVLTPRFSLNMQKIAYMSYKNNIPRVYIWDMETGKQTLLGNFPGMTYAPRFSPDSKSVIMSLAYQGTSNIFAMNLQTRAIKQLTNSDAIDTSPSYSPDGKQVVFNSDRSGTQQLYVMDSNGKNIKRISFDKDGRGRYATPVWSPRGDYIAFTKIKNGNFYIGVMYPDGSGERLLATGYLVEAPSWAPNGRTLLFFKQERPPKGSYSYTSRIYGVDITGRNLREIKTPASASDPTWSPLLQ